MKNKKKHQVVMLPSEKSNFGFGTDLDLDYKNLSFWNEKHSGEGIHPQDLYIVSKIENCRDVKSGDFVLDSENIIRKIQSITDERRLMLEGIAFLSISHQSCRKIEATSNLQLNQVPKILESFVKVFIKSNNCKEQIKEVYLEMIDNGEEGWSGSDEDGEPVWNEKWEIKTRNDNSVIIHQIRTYSEDDMRLAYAAGHLQKGKEGESFQKWIENFNVTL